MLPELVNNHDPHVCLRVCYAIEMFRHRRFLRSLMRDVVSVTINTTVEFLFLLTYILLATPPVHTCNQINYLWSFQGEFTFIWKCFPVIWLEHSYVASNIGQVLHLEAPHRQLSNGSWKVDVRATWTRWSLKYLERRKVINGGRGKAFHNHSEAWRVDRWCLVVWWKDYQLGWYVTTKGVRADLSWFHLDCKHMSLGVSSACWSSWFKCCSLYPRFRR